MSVAGQTILVTGAGSGIGRALTTGFAADGATVIAIDIDERGLESLAGDHIIAETVNVSDPVQVERMVESAVRATGRLDALFNNAGLGFRVPLVEHEPDQFEALIRVNLLGPYYSMKAAIPVMQAAGRGRIVNVLSRAAELCGRGFSAYASSKAALYALTRTAAREALGSGVLINGLIPGPTKSSMNPDAEQEPAAVYPTARWLAELPDDGPTGRVFWDMKEYPMFDEANATFRREID